MTIYRYDAPVKILSAKETNDSLIVDVALLAPYSDGSGKAGQKITNLPIHYLTATEGLIEIMKTIQQFTGAPAPDLASSSLADLVKIYNQYSSKKIKKFSDRATAIRRITDLMVQESEDMFAGEAAQPATDTQKESLRKKLANRNPSKEINQVVEAKGRKDKKIALNLTVTTTTGANTNTKEKTEKPKIRKNVFSGKKIFILKKSNPCKKGTIRFENWEKYRDGMSYEEYRSVASTLNHFRYDLSKGFIKLV
jgi:hypothetical protein